MPLVLALIEAVLCWRLYSILWWMLSLVHALLNTLGKHSTVMPCQMRCLVGPHGMQFNCLTKPPLCEPKTNELQRRKGDCPRFCGADGPRGACDGKGYCRYTMVKKTRIAICDCFRGYHRKLVKVDGIARYTCTK